jgi:hypothetical protein
MEAWVQWAGAELTLRVFVDGAPAHALVQGELGPLVEGLHRAGFARVDADVRIDPTRVLRDAQPSVSPAPPEGSIFSARA